MIYQLKQRDDRMEIAIILCQINEGHEDLAIPSMEEVARVSSYPLL